MPQDFSFCKQALVQGWSYEFRHRGLGQLGRIVLRETADGRSHISSEVAGDAKDPRTAERMAIFKPLALEIIQRIEAGGRWGFVDRWVGGATRNASTGTQGTDRKQDNLL